MNENDVFELQKLPDEPILIITVYDRFRIKQDLPAVISQLEDAFDSSEEPLYYINVAGNIKVNFGDMVFGLDMATRGNVAALRHPNLKKFVAVADNSLVQLATKALGQSQYGGKSFALFETLEDALASVRAEIAQEQGEAA